MLLQNQATNGRRWRKLMTLVVYVFFIIFENGSGAVLAEPKIRVTDDLPVAVEASTIPVQQDNINTNSVSDNTNINSVATNTNENIAIFTTEGGTSIARHDDGVVVTDPTKNAGTSVVVFPKEGILPKAFMEDSGKALTASYIYLRTAQNLLAVPKNIPYLTETEGGAIFSYLQHVEDGKMVIIPEKVEDLGDRYRIVLQEQLNGIPLEGERMTMIVSKSYKKKMTNTLVDGKNPLSSTQTNTSEMEEMGKIVSLSGTLRGATIDPSQTSTKSLEELTPFLLTILKQQKMVVEKEDAPFLDVKTVYYKNSDQRLAVSGQQGEQENKNTNASIPDTNSNNVHPNSQLNAHSSMLNAISTVRLGYRVQMSFVSPYSVWEMLIDAENGKLVEKNNVSLLQEMTTMGQTGSGVILYEGTSPSVSDPLLHADNQSLTTTSIIPAETQTNNNLEYQQVPVSDLQGQRPPDLGGLLEAIVQTVIMGKVIDSTTSWTNELFKPIAHLKIFLTNNDQPQFADGSGGVSASEKDITGVELSTPNFSIIDHNMDGTKAVGVNMNQGSSYVKTTEDRSGSGGLIDMSHSGNVQNQGTGKDAGQASMTESGSVFHLSTSSGSGHLITQLISTFIPLWDTTAFYYVDKAFTYAKNVLHISLPTITFHTNSPVVAALKTDSCGAFALPWKNEVHVGICGGTTTPASGTPLTKGEYNLALDQYIDFHETAHLLTEHLQPFLSYNDDVRAMREGVADFYAEALMNESPSGNVQNPSESETRVGSGSLLPTDYLQLFNTLTIKDKNKEPHHDGRIVAGALWDLSVGHAGNVQNLGTGNDAGQASMTEQGIGLTLTNQLLFKALQSETGSFDMLLYNMILADDSTEFGGDNNLTNGTPHLIKILTAFSHHGIGPGIGGWNQMGFNPINPDQTDMPEEALNILVLDCGGWFCPVGILYVYSCTGQDIYQQNIGGCGINSGLCGSDLSYYSGTTCSGTCNSWCNGVSTCGNAPNGTACTGGTCNGAGTCVASNTAPTLGGFSFTGPYSATVNGYDKTSFQITCIGTDPDSSQTLTCQGSWDTINWYPIATTTSPASNTSFTGSPDVSLWAGMPQGYTTIYVRVTDGTATSFVMTYPSVYIDTVFPTCGTTTFSPSGWTNGSVTATTACTDATSGCTQANFVDTPRSSNGLYANNIHDNAGNGASCGYNITNIDAATPTTSALSASPPGWTNAGVLVSGTCADTGGSGISGYYFRCSAGVAYTFTAVVNPNFGCATTGTNTASAYCVDTAGNVDATPSSVTYYYDATAPTIISATTSSPACNTVRFTVNGAADTGGSALSSTPYSFNAGVNWQASNYYDAPGTNVTISANNIQVRDNAGNIYPYPFSGNGTSSACNTAPNTPTNISPSNAAWRTSRQFCATVTDPDGGSLYAYFIIGGSGYYGNLVTSGSNSCYTYGGDLNGTTWYAYGYDGTAYSASYSTIWTAYIDTIAPTTTGAITGGTVGSNGWYTSNVTYTITPADATSGVASTVYCPDASNVCAPLIPYSSALTLSTDAAATYVRFKSTDTATNVQTVQSSGLIKIDKTAPSIAITDGANASWNTSDTITASPSDATSLVASTYYGFSADGICNGSDTYGTLGTSVVVNTAHTDYVCFKSTDNAGNIAYSTAQGPLKIDVTAPTASAVSNSANEGSTVLLTASASDGESSIASYLWYSDAGCVTSTGVTTSTYTAAVQNEPTSIIYYYKAQNGAGTWSSCATATATWNNVAPWTPFQISPAHNTWVPSRQFCATVSDTGGGNVYATFVIGGTSYTGSTVASGSNSCYTHTADLNGIGWYAYATDANSASSGNSGTWTAYIDSVAPTSSVTALATTQSALSFTVNWSGSDATSLIQNYDIQYKKNTGAWTDCSLANAGTSLTFPSGCSAPPPVANSDVFYFQSRARDNAGNLETYPGVSGDTSTTIQTNTAPTLTGGSTSQSYLSSLNATAFNVQCNGVTDPDSSQTITCQGSWDNINWNMVGTAVSPQASTTISSTPNVSTWTGYPADGTLKTMYMRVTDATATSTNQTFTVTKDTIAPTPNPSTGSAVANSTTQITWTNTTPTDGTSGLPAQPYSFDNGSTWQAGQTLAVSSYTANTTHTVTIMTRDAAGNVTTAGTIMKYTLANIPAVPTVSGGYNYTNKSYINVSVADGGGNPAYAIYIELGTSCDGVGGLGYVQADGSISGSVVWARSAGWGTKTIPNLTGSTPYTLCVKARNEDAVETAFGTGASVTTGAPSISLTSDGNKSYTLTPGSPNSVISTFTITADSNGYTLTAKRTNADYTLKQGSYFIADKTEWNSTTPTSTTWSGNGLGFRVYQTGTDASSYDSTWWGTDDTVTNAKYAGFPNPSSSTATIATKGVYSGSASTVKVEYKGQVSNLQESGIYAGTITYTLVAVP